MPITFSSENILYTELLPSGETRYRIRLVADSGYTEEQEYVGDMETLTEAQEHFNTSIAEIESRIITALIS